MRSICVIAVIIALFMASLLVVGNILLSRDIQQSKPYVTYTRLIYVASCCDKYKEQFGSWPTSLAQLGSFRPELGDWAKDAWGPGNSVWGHFAIVIPYNDALGYGEIISYGRDGIRGGQGDDQDMAVRFPIMLNSNWNEHVRAGLKRPKFRQ